ncbi:DUF350 domain-containing protein [Micromonospora sp. MED01]|uniref:DUF350 domain-containing protein n=1 Tax=Micromonospora alfalfae TaxID=2911212 RepID=UPI001EE83AB1|nr:DUF350 domain-containing protein [Micromonospora alfalfae]MCG5466901.1 DUF350 domain-containing protein [Micromonospora alfalfae]
MQNLVTDLLATLAFGAVGVVLMGVGYALVDLTTPGKLHELIWTGRNRNAALLLASNLLGVGTIVVAAIVASDDDFALGLVGAAAYGIVGLVVMAVAFLLLDAVTPGRLGELLVDPEPHPAVWVSAVVHLATGAIIAAAIL